MFLVLFGSLLGYTIYMRLLRDIGASRSGPCLRLAIVEVLLGVTIFAETVRPLDLLGMLIMPGAVCLTCCKGGMRIILESRRIEADGGER